MYCLCLKFQKFKLYLFNIELCGNAETSWRWSVFSCLDCMGNKDLRRDFSRQNDKIMNNGEKIQDWLRGKKKSNSNA